jgi:hypothetical protein
MIPFRMLARGYRIVMMHHVLGALMLLAISGHGTGDCAEATPEVIFEKLRTQYQRLDGVETTFIQTVRYVGFDTQQISRGTVLFKKPAKMRMEITRPAEQLIVTDYRLRHILGLHSGQRTGAETRPGQGRARIPTRGDPVRRRGYRLRV